MFVLQTPQNTSLGKLIWLGRTACLHHLILSKAAVRICIHRVTGPLSVVLDITQIEGSSTILVSLKFRDGCI